MSPLRVVALLVGLCCVHVHARRCYEVQEKVALFGYNDKKFYSQTMESCQRLCDQETEFTCISLDLTASGTCYLSQESHLTDPEMIGPHFGSTYASVVECTGEESGSSEQDSSEGGSDDGDYDGGRCYEVQNNRALFGNNDKTIDYQTMESCQRLCDQETEFTCISLDLTSSGTCHLSQESHVTDPEMFGPHHQATYASVVECVIDGNDSSEENEIDETGNEEGGDDGDVFECTDTAHYEGDTCEMMLDGDLDTWWQVPHSYTGESVTFRFAEPRVIERIDVWSHRLVMGQCSVLEFEMNGRTEELRRVCQPSISATEDEFYIRPVRTDFVRMTCVRRCSSGQPGWYLFAEIEFHGVTSDGDDDSESGDWFTAFPDGESGSGAGSSDEDSESSEEKDPLFTISYGPSNIIQPQERSFSVRRLIDKLRSQRENPGTE